MDGGSLSSINCDMSRSKLRGGIWGPALSPSEAPDGEKTSPKMTSSSSDTCPVDHSSATAETWSAMASNLPVDHPPVPTSLPSTRETSSIPRTDGTKWQYPSQSQFYSAMARKDHSPRASDMPVLVPIHNAVNERAWAQLMEWERVVGAGEKCGGIKLVSFKGRPRERSIKARWNILLG